VRVWTFVNDEKRMTSRIIADTEQKARMMLPEGIDWELES